MHPNLMFNPSEAFLHNRLRPMRMQSARKIQEDYLRNLRLIQLQRNFFFPTLRCPFPVKPFPLRPSVVMFSRQEQRRMDQIDIWNTIKRPMGCFENLSSSHDVNNNTGLRTHFQPNFEDSGDNRFGPLVSASSSSAIECQRQDEDSAELKKSFSCPQCKYTTDRKNNLKRHVITMHFDCDRKLECCGSTFRSKAKLREHVLLFHKDGYRCLICQRTFCRKALLRRHMAVHSGRKDFICDLCDYATSHKSNLERHQKVHLKARGPKQCGENLSYVHKKYERKTIKISGKTGSLQTHGDAFRYGEDTPKYRDDVLGGSYDNPNVYSITTENEKIEFNGIRMENSGLINHKTNELFGKETTISFDANFQGVATDTIENENMLNINRTTGVKCDINELDENCNNIAINSGSSVITISMEERIGTVDKNSDDIQMDTKTDELNCKKSQKLIKIMDTSDEIPDLFIGSESKCISKTNECDGDSVHENVKLSKYENVSCLKPVEFTLYSEISSEKPKTENKDYPDIDTDVSNFETENISDCENGIIEHVRETKTVRVLPIKSISSKNSKTISESIGDKPEVSLGVTITTDESNTGDVIDSKYDNIAQIKDPQRLCNLPYRCANCKNRFKIQTDFLQHICKGSMEGHVISDASAFPLVSKLIKTGQT